MLLGTHITTWWYGKGIREEISPTPLPGILQSWVSYSVLLAVSNFISWNLLACGISRSGSELLLSCLFTAVVLGEGSATVTHLWGGSVLSNGSRICVFSGMILSDKVCTALQCNWLWCSDDLDDTSWYNTCESKDLPWNFPMISVSYGFLWVESISNTRSPTVVTYGETEPSWGECERHWGCTIIHS